LGTISFLQAYPVKFSVVTLSFNQDRFLQHTLDSIRISSPHQLQYVIVDAGSADGLNKGFAACDGDRCCAAVLPTGSISAATPTVSAASGTFHLHPA
jgi:hypothetical protein